MSRLQRLVFIAALAFVHLYAFPYFGALKHANELPRVLTTMELVRARTFRLDARMEELGSTADISNTPDGHKYQNKSPGLSIVAAPVYGVLSALYGVFGAAPSLRLTTWVLRVSFVVLPAVLFLLVFRHVAERFAGANVLARDGALLAYAFGSLAFPYALVFMSHVPAAVAIGGAFALAIALTRDERPNPERLALGIGLLMGLAMLVEYQAIFAAAWIGGYVALRFRPKDWRTRLLALGAMTIGAVPFIVALGAYHAACFGSPFRTGYAYGAFESNRVGFMGIIGPTGDTATQLLTLGNNGLFVLSPWVVLSVVGAVAIARHRDKRARVGAEAVVASGIALTYVLFVASLHPEFGRAGWSVGPRYIAVAMPFFAWLAASGIEAACVIEELKVPVLATLLAAVAINVVAATTYPHWPNDLANPLFEISLRLLREGHAPHSLGTAVGLRGLTSLLPLYVAIAGGVVWLLRRAGVPWLYLGIAAALVPLAVSRFENFTKTPEPIRSEMWTYVVSTYEP